MASSMGTNRGRLSLATAVGVTCGLVVVAPAQADDIARVHSHERASDTALIATDAAAVIDQGYEWYTGNSGYGFDRAEAPEYSGSEGPTVTLAGPDLTISAVTEGGLSLSADDDTFQISLPHAEGETVRDVSNNVDVVLGDGAVDNVVERFATGLRAMTVIHDENAPKWYPYTIDGGTFTELEDGSVAVVNEEGVIVLEVAPAWAVDAEGNDVPTWYQVDGDVLRQYVDHRSASYPVTADPSFRVTWNKFWITWNRAEVRALRGMSRTYTFYGAVCAPISAAGPPGWIGASVCATALAAVGTSIHNTWMNAAANNRCMEIGMLRPPFPPAVTDWRSLNC